MADTLRKDLLLIDDEKGYHEMFRFILEPLGFRVFSAYDGEDGLAMAQTGSYDLIFCDFHMPKMNGDEVMRKLPPAKAALVVMLMGSDPNFNRQFEDKTREAGAKHYLRKPFDFAELTAVIEAALGIRIADQHRSP